MCNDDDIPSSPQQCDNINFLSPLLTTHEDCNEIKEISLKKIPDLCTCVVDKILFYKELILMKEEEELCNFFCAMSRKRGYHEIFFKQYESMHQKLTEIESKNYILKHHICYNHIDRFKHYEEEVAVVPPECYSLNWIEQFLYQIPELVTIKLHNEDHDKMVHLKYKIKS